MKEEELQILRVISVLPYKSYPVSDLLLYAGSSRPEKDGMVLEKLGRMGWLEITEVQCSMHPVIAESIRKTKIAENDFPYLWPALEHKMNYSDQGLGRENTEQIEATWLLVQVLRMIAKPHNRIIMNL